MVVFLTGANGGIGSVIAETLKKSNIKVIKPTSRELNLSSNFKVEHTVDGFIHCAGINKLKNHSELESEELNNIFQINTFSFIRLCNQLNFNSGSNIIAIGSLYSTETKENRIQYSMSKHALFAAVKTLAIEKSNQNIKVNMISPGFIDTNMTQLNNTPERIEYLRENIPLGLTNPKEIANMCLYLIKQNNSITGQNIQIDGGYTLKRL
jgi:NAD(P)-dependent dehydrogenase (short-subunit alcohol dehydrogenase family)